MVTACGLHPAGKTDGNMPWQVAIYEKSLDLPVCWGSVISPYVVISGIFFSDVIRFLIEKYCSLTLLKNSPFLSGMHEKGELRICKIKMRAITLSNMHVLYQFINERIHLGWHNIGCM